MPAPEVNLIMLVETVLGPFWVWLALKEAAPRETWIGGAILIGALVIHSMLSLRASTSRKGTGDQRLEATIDSTHQPLRQGTRSS